VLALVFSLSIIDAFNCPPNADISPCSCGGIAFTNETDQLLIISCNSKNLDDAKAKLVIDALLSNPNIDPVRALGFFNNSLTKVPDKLSQFPELENVNLAMNRIRSVPTGAFNFKKPLRVLDLGENEIDTISQDAFQGNYSQNQLLGGSQLRLFNNKLTRFEAQVYQNVLEQMDPDCNPAIYSCGVIIDNNPIDCESDSCHLAWLIRDNPHLLGSLTGKCSNGTEWRDLEPTTICKNSGSSQLYTNLMPIIFPLILLIIKQFI